MPTTHHTTLPPPFPGAPAFSFHLTRLADTLFVWVGAAERAEDEPRRNLAQEWAVAMPSHGVSWPPWSKLTAEHPRHRDARVPPGRGGYRAADGAAAW
jgi:hypothetical protein